MPCSKKDVGKNTLMFMQLPKQFLILNCKEKKTTMEFDS